MNNDKELSILDCTFGGGGHTLSFLELGHKVMAIDKDLKAQEIANNVGLDLVEISPNSKPPVCKILDYGKFLYEIEKQDKLNKKKISIYPIPKKGLGKVINERLNRAKVNE